MNGQDLIAELADLGVRLWEEDGQLRFRAPAGVLTDQRRAALRQHREEVLAALRDAAVPAAVPHPEQRHEPFPLTDVQSAYLLGRGETFAYGGVGCHGYGELAFTDLDVDRLEHAWRDVVARHDMLRAVVNRDGSQQVRPDVPPYRIEVRDVDPAGFADAVAGTRAELDHRRYDPQRWPLFTLTVTRAPGRSVLHFSIDFLVCDFVSINLLLDELGRRYAGDPPGDDLELTFRDHLLATAPLRDGPRRDADRDWWLARLDDLPPAPELPLRPDALAAPPRFRRLDLRLDPSEWAGLRQRAGRHGITPSGAVLAAYAEVIAAWSTHPRFSVDVTLLDRTPTHPQVDRIVGDFTSVSLLAVEQDPDAPVQERAKRLQAQLWSDLDHRRFSGVDVLREVARRRGPDAALMPVVFTSAIGLGGDTGVEGFGELGYGISQTPQVWIDCQNIERSGSLATNWDVREGVFPDGVVDEMFAAYTTLLRRLAGTDEAWEELAPVTLPAASARRRAEVNDTAAPLPDGLLHEGVLAQALRTPDRVAVVAPDASLTYRQLTGRASAVAARLTEAGCRPGDLVAVVADKGWRQVVAVFGALLAGAAYVPIDTNQPPARRDLILAGAAVRFVLTEADRAAGSWPEGVRAVDVDDCDGPAPAALPARLAGPDDLAYVIHTSGSTGTPKGVMITHRAALNTVVDINTRFDVTPDDRILGLANLGFDLSVYDLFGPPAVGAALVLPDPERRGDPTHWADLVTGHEVTLWNSVPAQLQMLADYLAAAPMVRTPSLRLALLSGDWIPVTLPDEIRHLVPGLAVVSLGGATEAAIWSIIHPVGAVDRSWRSIPYGVPLANQSWHVRDAGLRDRPDWVTGELCIGGAGLALGYLGDVERTAERFVTDPVTGQRLYRTGDLGRYRPDGVIEFLGRDDHQVKVRGHRIELAEVESALLAHPAVGAAVAVVDGDRPLERKLAAAVQPAAVEPGPAPSVDPAGPTAAGAAVVAGTDLDGYAAYLHDLDRLGLAAMLDTLRAAGLFLDDRPHPLAEVYAATGVAPRHRRLLRRWLRALTDSGVLRRDDDAYRLVRALSPAARAWDAAARRAAQVGEAPELVRYFQGSAAALPALLRDDEDPLALLFPAGELAVSDNLYTGALFNRWANAVAATAVRALVERLPAPVRIVEVGAGSGGTTAAVLDALDGLDVDYLYTDLSGFFVEAGRQRFGDRPGLRFATLDLDADPAGQGIAGNSADLVIAGDVLHATRDVPATLARLRGLLAPGGHLVLLEMTREHYQIMTSLELLVRLDDESGDFADLRRGTDRTFLDADEWRGLLAGAGAAPVLDLPAPDDPMAGLGMRIIAARVKADRRRVVPDELRAHLAERLPDYMAPSVLQVVDELPRTANGKLDRAAVRRLVAATTAGPEAGGAAPSAGLEEEIAAVWADVLRLDRISRDADFFASGGDSLLAAKLAGQLAERVPAASGVFFDELLRTILEHPTVGALAGRLAASTGSPAPDDGADAAAIEVTRLAGDGPPRFVLVHDGSGRLDGYAGLPAPLAAGGAVWGVADGGLHRHAGLDPAPLVQRLAADYAAELAGHLTAEPLSVVGRGEAGALALELARQLTESGVDVTGLVVADPVPGDAYASSPYAGDVTLLCPDEPDPAAVAWWREVCLGELAVARVPDDPAGWAGAIAGEG
ncbi:amino acid adenylation domain-containing protein [Micromonospora sp. NPDC050980]|uniref:amino acid adenylation domain-containing protein n=1 Tax=Micromonospora sp. NPDC050980 TaxID=3155161 RepID=UPI0033C51127